MAFNFEASIEDWEEVIKDTEIAIELLEIEHSNHGTDIERRLVKYDEKKEEARREIRKLKAEAVKYEFGISENEEEVDDVLGGFSVKGYEPEDEGEEYGSPAQEIDSCSLLMSNWSLQDNVDEVKVPARKDTGNEVGKMVEPAHEGEDMQMKMKSSHVGDDMQMKMKLNHEGDDMQMKMKSSHEGENMQTMMRSTNEGDVMQMKMKSNHEGDDMQIKMKSSHEGDDMQMKMNPSQKGENMQMKMKMNGCYQPKQIKMNGCYQPMHMQMKMNGCYQPMQMKMKMNGCYQPVQMKIKMNSCCQPMQMKMNGYYQPMQTKMKMNGCYQPMKLKMNKPMQMNHDDEGATGYKPMQMNIKMKMNHGCYQPMHMQIKMNGCYQPMQMKMKMNGCYQPMQMKIKMNSCYQPMKLKMNKPMQMNHDDEGVTGYKPMQMNIKMKMNHDGDGMNGDYKPMQLKKRHMIDKNVDLRRFREELKFKRKKRKKMIDTSGRAKGPDKLTTEERIKVVVKGYGAAVKKEEAEGDGKELEEVRERARAFKECIGEVANVLNGIKAGSWNKSVPDVEDALRELEDALWRAQLYDPKQ